MKFDNLDKAMRVYETAHDRNVLPNMYIIARIDGRGFTKLTKETGRFIAPFDDRFRDLMIETVKHLMGCGFNIIFGYTQSDEISLLFHLEETLFARKTRKFISILAGEASAKFSSLYGDVATFDCRLSELPNSKLVEDYFRWRNEDAHRNSLNAHSYWLLRQDGLNKTDATKRLQNLSISDKNELLFQYGINFNELPKWQKRGIGFYWKNIEKQALNPKDNTHITVTKRELFVDFDLPLGEGYNQLISEIIYRNQ